MFIDEVRILVVAGKGGDGAMSFRREKYVPRGGPDGGNGGRGGHVYLQVDRGLSTLSDLRYKRRFKAENGANGGKSNKTGKSGQDLVIRVPPGTMVFWEQPEKERLLCDLTGDGRAPARDRYPAARGGRGGRGNAVFAGPTYQAPRFAEKGEPGEEKQLRLELKLLADVGLVGYPNAGKSTLLSVISAARPKVAAYPFTTLSPVLGVVEIGDESFVVADLPGLVEEAHKGVGLGHRFLRHIERTRLLLHLVDLAVEGEDPLVVLERVKAELAAYSSELAEKPQIIVGTKKELPRARENWEIFQEILNAKGCEVYGISAVTGEGVKELLYRVAGRLKELPLPKTMEPGFMDHTDAQAPFSDEERDFWIIKEKAGVFRIEGEELLKRIARYDLNQEEAVLRLQKYLRRRGVETALKKAGVKEGDLVRAGKIEFIYLEVEPDEF